MKKLEFYFILFGIGIGLFLSGVFVRAYPIPHIEYTDEEIKEKARDLGMVGLRESIEGNLDEGDDGHVSDESADTVARGETTLEEARVLTLAVNRGDGTSTISQELERVGLIEEASAFEQFIWSKEAGNSLREGTYEIEQGSDFDTILTIITKGAF